MWCVALIKAAAIGVAGIGVGMALGDHIKNGIKRCGRFVRETKNAYREGELSANSEARDLQMDLSNESVESVDVRASSTSSQTNSDVEISRLKENLSVAERENGELKRECDSLQLKLKEVQGKLEVLFPKVVKRLYLMSEQPEIKAILEENGLSLYTDFASFCDGFMRIKNESVTEAVLIRPALVRGDDLIEPGIIHVPMNEAGAEPPQNSSLALETPKKMNSFDRQDTSVNENKETDSATNDVTFHDDFVVI